MNRWDRRIERAEVLEREYPAAAEFLRFYGEIARFQKHVAESKSGPVPLSVPEFWTTELLALLERVAPADLAQTAAILGQYGAQYDGRYDNWDPSDPAVGFIHRVLAQPYAESRARDSIADRGTASATCPVCGELPVAAVLRPEGDGGKRSLICSLCFTEWNFRRVLCPHCGEEDQQRLPIYTAEPFPHVRIEACDTCHTYVKSIDMTRNGLAVPEVDELASLPLDLWAAEHNYTKLQPNLFGL